MNAIHYFIQAVQEKAAEHPLPPQSLIRYLDLTCLDDHDTEGSIQALCQRAQENSVAAVCVYPQWLSFVKAQLKGSAVERATVVNFPTGQQMLSEVLQAIEMALKEGATEIDVVVPYQAFIAHQDARALKTFVQACKAEVSHHVLKVIVESGAFLDDNFLERAALVCLEGGADFLKTSTGNIPQGASLKAVAIFLGAIQRFGDLTRGLKVSGGVQHYAQAKAYYLLTEIMMSTHWATPKTFRIGASRLLEELQQQRDLDLPPL